MPKILNVKSYSFNAKVAVSLFILALLLITILFALIVPKMQKEEYNATIKEIEQVLAITKEQIQLAGKSIEMQKILEKESIKNSFALELSNLKNSYKNNFDLEDIKKTIERFSSLFKLSYAIKINNKIYIKNQEEIYKKHKIKNYDMWEGYNDKRDYNNYSYVEEYFFYTTKISENIEITLFAEEYKFNPNHLTFEYMLKENIQNTFNITQDLHKGKTYVFWLNTKFQNNNDEPLFVKDDKKTYPKYTVSKLSNVTNIYTGDLTTKQVLEAKNKNFVEHTLDGKAAISWIIDVYNEVYDGDISLLVKTVYKEDLINQIDSALLKILPAALISLLLALVIGFFLFRRLFKSITTLTNTAKEVNSGNRKIRSNVTGNDDIGYLGVAFDSMLDSFENNIKTLDMKVEEKTKKLQTSLEEKDILLKEIHHRVKNNLALTISLIKLQQEEIEEEKAQKTLIDIQERIYTMELLHRKLYESTNLNKIDFKEYVENLLNNISMTYMYENCVQKDVEIKDVYLNIEKAMPCGLILNEIITNAFKYAFKDNDNPKISISMKKEKEQYVLVIKDNGKGINEGIDIYNSNTLGLKLINSISTLQLKGTFEYSYQNGAIFKIIF